MTNNEVDIPYKTENGEIEIITSPSADEKSKNIIIEDHPKELEFTFMINDSKADQQNDDFVIGSQNDSRRNTNNKKQESKLDYINKNQTSNQKKESQDMLNEEMMSDKDNDDIKSESENVANKSVSDKQMIEKLDEIAKYHIFEKSEKQANKSVDDGNKQPNQKGYEKQADKSANNGNKYTDDKYEAIDSLNESMDKLGKSTDKSIDKDDKHPENSHNPFTDKVMKSKLNADVNKIPIDSLNESIDKLGELTDKSIINDDKQPENSPKIELRDHNPFFIHKSENQTSNADDEKSISKSTFSGGFSFVENESNEQTIVSKFKKSGSTNFTDISKIPINIYFKNEAKSTEYIKAFPDKKKNEIEINYLRIGDKVIKVVIPESSKEVGNYEIDKCQKDIELSFNPQLHRGKKKKVEFSCIRKEGKLKSRKFIKIC